MNPSVSGPLQGCEPSSGLLSSIERRPSSGLGASTLYTSIEATSGMLLFARFALQSLGETLLLVKASFTSFETLVASLLVDGTTWDGQGWSGQWLGRIILVVGT